MADTIQAFLASVEDAASALTDASVRDLMHAVRAQVATGALRLLVVGQTGAGRSAIVNLLLGQPDLLPVSPVPKAPLPIVLSYGPARTIEVLARDGTRTAVPGERLRAFLTGPDAASGRYDHVLITSPAELLTNCQLRVETIDAERAPGQWNAVLAAADFTLVVLKATALLSERERSFLRDVLHPSVGLQRAAIIMNQMDLVPEEEHDVPGRAVRAFLGPLESYPAVLEVSAGTALRALRAGRTTDGTGAPELQHLVGRDLVERQAALKATALRQAAELCLAEIEAAAKREQALLAVGTAEVERLLSEMDARAGWVQAQVQRAQQRVETAINTLLKEEFLREVEGFSAAFAAQLPAQVADVQDLGVARRHLPGYIEAVWREFFAARAPIVRDRVSEELRHVAAQVGADLRELAGERAALLEHLTSTFQAGPASMHPFWLPRRAESTPATFAGLLQLGGAMLLLNPLTAVLGAGSFGAGQLLRLFTSDRSARATRQAMVEAALGAWRDLERQIKQQVAEQFTALATDLKGAVAEIYQRAQAAARDQLAAALARQQAITTRRDDLDRLVDSTLPALRVRLADLTQAHPTVFGGAGADWPATRQPTPLS